MFSVGQQCNAYWEDDGKYYKAVIDSVTEYGTYFITFVDFGSQFEMYESALQPLEETPLSSSTKSLSSSSTSNSTSTTTSTSTSATTSATTSTTTSASTSTTTSITTSTPKASSNPSSDKVPTNPQLNPTPFFFPAVSTSAFSMFDDLLEKTPRNRVACEIVQTEKSYVDSLHVLVDLYIIPLSSRAKGDDPILPLDLVQILFSNIELIYTLNTNFLRDLTNRMVSWDKKEVSQQMLGDLFLQFCPYFKMYAQYCATYDESSKLLEKLKAESRYEKFVNFEREASFHPRIKGLNLSSFLIMPIQRIPRYKLLLDEFLKKTEMNHPDYEHITKALVQVQSVANHINEAVKKRENREEILRLQSLFTSDPRFVHPS